MGLIPQIPCTESPSTLPARGPWSGVRRPEGPLIRAGPSVPASQPPHLGSGSLQVAKRTSRGQGCEPGWSVAGLETPKRPTWVKQALGLHVHARRPLYLV